MLKLRLGVATLRLAGLLLLLAPVAAHAIPVEAIYNGFLTTSTVFEIPAGPITLTLTSDTATPNTGTATVSQLLGGSWSLGGGVSGALTSLSYDSNTATLVASGTGPLGLIFEAQVFQDSCSGFGQAEFIFSECTQFSGGTVLFGRLVPTGTAVGSISTPPSVNIVPEPGTAVLVLLGTTLLASGRGRRRRSQVPAAVLVAGALLASSASSAAPVLDIIADKATYSVGETITLSIVGDSDGGAATSVFGEIFYDDSLTTVTSATQDALTTFGSPWTLSLLFFGGGSSVAFNQLFGFFPSPVDGPLSATVLLTADAVGTVNFGWNTGSLNFFGVSSPSGETVTIVPEPSTALLLGLGFATLSARRRSGR